MTQSISEFDAIVQLSGGFGNQLFQYAFGMQLEAVHGCRVGYDIEFYKIPNSVAHNRLQLVEYGFDVAIAPPRHKSYEAARRLKWLPASAQQALFGMTFVKCPATRFAPVSPPAGLTYFTGLWHSPRYFDQIQSHVRETVRQRLLSQANGTHEPRSNVIGFHVRRGDYLAHKQSYNLDYAAYLTKALAHVSAATGRQDMLISVYSDDPDWCAENLSAPNLEINRGSGMLDDLLGLMCCEHKIISNSTFAWWAAFLGDSGKGLTLAPKHWHAEATSAKAQVLCDGWHLIDDRN